MHKHLHAVHLASFNRALECDCKAAAVILPLRAFSKEH